MSSLLALLLGLLFSFIISFSLWHHAKSDSQFAKLPGIEHSTTVQDLDTEIYGNPLAFCPVGHFSQLNALLASQPRGLVIDVGAHDGSDTLQYAKSGHEVICFEPSPYKINFLRDRLSQNGVSHLVTLHEIALSNYTGKSNFQVNDNLSKRDLQRGLPRLGSEQDAFYVPWSGSKSIPVNVDILDKYIADRHVLFMKVDAQGHDVEVLEGARKAINERRITVFSFEVSPKLSREPSSYLRVLRWLRGVGYSCFDCKFFKTATLRGKTPHPLRISSSLLLEAIHDLQYFHRQADHGHYTELVCTVLGAK